MVVGLEEVVVVVSGRECVWQMAIVYVMAIVMGKWECVEVMAYEWEGFEVEVDIKGGVDVIWIVVGGQVGVGITELHVTDRM